MKLYSSDLSNFASKTRIAIREKGLNVELIKPPGGTGSTEYRKLNPLGKIPALELDNGQVIAESETINEYLEERYPQNPLLPKDAASRALVRTFSRLNDLYLDPPFRSLLPQLFGKKLDVSFVQEKLAEINNRLDQLEGMIGSPWAAGDTFTLADAALTPTLFLIVNILPQFGVGSPVDSRPKLAAWWKQAQGRPSIRKTLDEQRTALTALMTK